MTLQLAAQPSIAPHGSGLVETPSVGPPTGPPKTSHADYAAKVALPAGTATHPPAGGCPAAGKTVHAGNVFVATRLAGGTTKPAAQSCSVQVFLVSMHSFSEGGYLMRLRWFFSCASPIFSPLADVVTVSFGCTS